jgi:hypothetical protein
MFNLSQQMMYILEIITIHSSVLNETVVDLTFKVYLAVSYFIAKYGSSINIKAVLG